MRWEYEHYVMHKHFELPKRNSINHICVNNSTNKEMWMITNLRTVWGNT